MIDLYENEVELVYDTVQYVQRKFSGKMASGENLTLLQKELVGRLEDLGFGCTVDVTPIAQGLPISLRIDSRLENRLFDAERKRWEVQRRDDDTPVSEIEGLV